MRIVTAQELESWLTSGKVLVFGQVKERDGSEYGADMRSRLKRFTDALLAKDGTIAALLGASPGASTAAPIMLTVLEKTFKDRIKTPEWQAKLKQIVPTYGQKLNNNLELTNKTREWSSSRLNLLFVPVLPDETAVAVSQ